MRRLRQFIVVLAFCTAVSLRSQEPSKRIATGREAALDQLHEILRQQAGPGDASRHNAYLSLMQGDLGNEETVPLLLERLRLDYGASEPVPPPGVQFGFICTQVHLVDALRLITNSDRGMYYPRWAAWWEANRGFPRRRWILDGFAAGGLHAIDPLDERFGLELIGLLGDNRQYYALNARRLLASVQPAQRADWVVDAAASDQRVRRLGALKDLNQIDTTGYEDLVRKLTFDPDQEVRRLAVDTLNGRSHGVRQEH